MKSWRSVPVPALGSGGGRPRVHDTASGELVEVGPASGTARLYVCGITPYDATHLGHAFTYLAFDTLQRVWLDAGLRVDYAQNTTDVDDPLLERAVATGVDWRELATSQIDLFRSDMEALRILPPTHFSGVVESMPLITDAIAKLAASGAAYQLDDAYPDWYFPCSAPTGDGEVAHLTRSEALEIFGERGGDPGRPGKKDALDSLLWRQARPGEPSWPSDLGEGRPGWHIECAAIALDALGPEIDVQGGGSDLIYPHHEMTAAQASALTGRRYARAFLHTGMVGYEGEKMSKSRGNLVFVSKLVEGGADPMAVRLALLNHHYRSEWEWTDADLTEATERLRRWRGAMNEPTGLPADQVVAGVRAALRDDLNTPDALAQVDAWVAGSADVDTDDTDAPRAIQQMVDALLGVDLRWAH